MIRWLLVSWLVNALVLGLTGWVFGGVTFHVRLDVIFAAAVFGVLNTILKPILKLITLPFAILTLGIAWFFVSIFTLWLTVLIVPKFDIDGFWNYVWATIIIWALNLIVDAIMVTVTGAGGVASRQRSDLADPTRRLGRGRVAEGRLQRRRVACWRARMV